MDHGSRPAFACDQLSRIILSFHKHLAKKNGKNKAIIAASNKILKAILLEE